jgi:hypothetical protein
MEDRLHIYTNNPNPIFSFACKNGEVAQALQDKIEPLGFEGMFSRLESGEPGALVRCFYYVENVGAAKLAVLFQEIEFRYGQVTEADVDTAIHQLIGA